MSNEAPATPPNEPWCEIVGSPRLVEWLAEHRVGLAFTTYQTGKLFLLGRHPDGRLAVFERTFNRAMGLCADGDGFWLGTKFQLWRFDNYLRPREQHMGHDKLYVPKVGHTTGDLDVHDLAITASGKVVFAATMFNCLATLADRASFTPLWRPPFISQLINEDRCHLNGVALVDGQPRYATAVSASDVVDGWRDRRRDGGLLMDVSSGAVVASGFSMPHSPRWRDGRVWLHDSGRGWLGSVDPAEGVFKPLVFCPGYLRGLAFVGDFAVVGISRPRHDKTFGGLELDDELKKRDAEARCGLLIIDLKTGQIAHWLRVEGMVRELYDVAVLHETVRPMALGFKTTEIERIIALGEASSLEEVR